MASQRLQAKVEAFRVQKETIKARYTATEGVQSVREAFAIISKDTSDPEETNTETDSESDLASASAAEDELRQEIRDLTLPWSGNSGPAEEDDIDVPPGMMELRPGAPDYPRAGVLFVVEPSGTAVLVGWVEDPGGSRRDYREAIDGATARLATAQPDDPRGSPGFSRGVHLL